MVAPNFPISCPSHLEKKRRTVYSTIPLPPRAANFALPDPSPGMLWSYMIQVTKDPLNLPLNLCSPLIPHSKSTSNFTNTTIPCTRYPTLSSLDKDLMLGSEGKGNKQPLLRLLVSQVGTLPHHPQNLGNPFINSSFSLKNVRNTNGKNGGSIQTVWTKVPSHSLQYPTHGTI